MKIVLTRTQKSPIGRNNPIGRSEKWHDDIQGCFQRFEKRLMDILLLCSLLVKANRHQRIAACYASWKNDKYGTW